MSHRIKFWQDLGDLRSIFFEQGGRITRRQYTISYFLLMLGILVLIGFSSYFFLKQSMIFVMVFVILGLLTLYISINMGIKRFHDFGLKGINILRLLVPFANFYFAFKLLLERGQSTENEYGPAIVHHYQINKAYLFLGIFLVSFGSFIVFVGAILFGLKSSGAYKLTQTEIMANTEIQDKYGNFDLGLFPMGSIELQNGEGQANFRVKIIGEGSEGFVTVDLLKKNGEWEVVDMEW